MSFVDRTAPLPMGEIDDSVVIEFDEHPPEDTSPIITEVGDGVLVDFEPTTENEIPADLPHDANLAEYLEEDYLKMLATELESLYLEDKESRADWLKRFTEGLDELGFTDEDKTEPFEGASGVFHPLLAEAAAQFSAQAYKELLPSDGPVSIKQVGHIDKQNPQAVALEGQAARVKEFMNYQITEVMEEYDPELDQMLFYLSLSGSAFKKVYFDEALGRAVSQYCTAEDIVVNYGATSLKNAQRITHVFRKSANDLRKEQLFGFYRDIEISDPGEHSQGEVESKLDELYGSKKTTQNDEYEFHEIHTELDLKGLEHEDGLMLPYIVTICSDTGDILAIRRNWDEGDTRFTIRDYFIHYKFLPGLGFYGFGFIHMIGGLSSSATSILRQLIDAGTFANLPGGFKMRGVRVDDSPVSPGEWRDIDIPNENINNALMPLPYKEPSNVLFQLLGFIVDSGRRFASIADTTISESGSQQNPVGTTMALIERGAKVMSAVHKRLHNAQKREFKLLAKVFGESLPPEYPYSVGGVPKTVKQQDFGPEIDVIPVSDPNIFSASQRVSLAQMQLQMAQSNPELHDLRESYRRMYIALEIKDPEGLLKPNDDMKPLTPALEHARAIENKKLNAQPDQNHQAHIQAHIAFMQSPMIQQNPDYASNMLQNIMQHISFLAQQQAQQQMQTQMQGISPNPQMQSQMAQMVAQIESQMIGQIMQQVTPQQPDPMVQMHEKEMQQKAQSDQMRNQTDQQKIMADTQKAQNAEITKRMQIAAGQEQANQDIAQKREKAFIDGNLQRAGIYAKALSDAEKNDITINQQNQGVQNGNQN